MSIVVADYDEIVTGAINYLLECKGYKVIEASSGEDVLDLYQTADIDLIIIDIEADGIDGLTLKDKLGDVQFIFISNNPELSSEVQEDSPFILKSNLITIGSVVDGLMLY